MAYILFSPVGTTDPIRDGFDGSMLHIVRHYRPKLVRLFVSRELWKNEQEFEWYSGFVKAVSPETEVSFADVLDGDPSDFELFPGLFEREIRALLDEHPGDTLLVNVSSGTTQMKTALTVLASTAFPQIQAVQVRTPSKKSNVHTAHDAPGADIRDALASLFDHDPEYGTENRCEELKLENYVSRRLRENVRSMIQGFAYEAAWNLVKQNSAFFSDKAAHAVCGAAKRKQFELLSAGMEFKQAGLAGIMPLGHGGAEAKALEFYLGMKSDLFAGDYVRFFVRMSPLAEEMARYTLKRRFGLDIERYLDANQKVMDQKLRNAFPDFETLQRWTIKPNQPSLELYKRLLDYSAARQGKKGDELVERFKQLRKLQELRNDAAHEMKAVKESDVSAFWKDADLGAFSQENAEQWLDTLFSDVYQSVSFRREMLKSYQAMNEAILDVL